MTSEGETELVARAVDGDRQAFGNLVQHFAGSVRRVARAVLRDPDEADDAAQDAFVRAFENLHRFDRRRPFGPWLMQIVANAARDRLRRQAVRRAAPLDEELPASDPQPSEEVERAALGERLREALNQLPERRRLAVVLFDVEGYSSGEIAGILRIPEGTVRSEVFHARRALRTLLKSWKADHE
jgi:RNA polymerase sigma-70 factor (ECF subfamily)